MTRVVEVVVGRWMRAPSRVPWLGVAVPTLNIAAAYLNEVVDGEWMWRDGRGGRTTRSIITHH